MTYFKHDSAIVEEPVKIGNGSKIWHWTHICQGATIGNNCVIGQNGYIGGKAIIGNNVKVQNNVSVYDCVHIEDDVFCGPSVVFTNVKNPRSFVERKSEYKLTKIGKGATLGANCTIICGVSIGKYAFIGAGCVVTKDVLDYAVLVGVPAKQVGWMSCYGDRLDLPLTGSGLSAKCPHSGEIYMLQDNIVLRKGS